jgi:hypothetical protein
VNLLEVVDGPEAGGKQTLAGPFWIGAKIHAMRSG